MIKVRVLFLLAVCLIAPFARGATSLGYARLSPCASVATADSLELAMYARVHHALGFDPPYDKGYGWPVVRVFVSPGNTALGEMSVIVYIPNAGDATLEVRQANRNIWMANYVVANGRHEIRNKPARVDVSTSRIVLPRQIAQDLQSILWRLLKDVAYPSNFVEATHPTSYEFVGNLGPGVELCGSASSATLSHGSQLGVFVDLWEDIANLPALEEESRAEAVKRIAEIAGSLSSEADGID